MERNRATKKRATDNPSVAHMNCLTNYKPAGKAAVAAELPNLQPKP
jgi:hypothetical protein